MNMLPSRRLAPANPPIDGFFNALAGLDIYSQGNVNLMEPLAGRPGPDDHPVSK